MNESWFLKVLRKNRILFTSKKIYNSIFNNGHVWDKDIRNWNKYKSNMKNHRQYICIYCDSLLTVVFNNRSDPFMARIKCATYHDGFYNKSQSCKELRMHEALK